MASPVKRWSQDLSAWLASLRVSGVTVLVIGAVIAGVVMLSPSVTTYVQQQRDLAQLRQSVAEHREAVADIDAERSRWRDPAHIRAQARDRLLYVMPGETQLSIIDDVMIPEESTAETEATLTEATSHWAEDLVASVILSGAVEVPAGEAESEPSSETEPEPAA